MPVYDLKNVRGVWVNEGKEIVGPCCLTPEDVISKVITYDEKDSDFPFVVCDRCKKMC